MRARIARALGLGVLLPGALGAQTIRGQVFDSLTGEPVGRGYVVLLDAAGREVVRTLSTWDGRFVLEAPEPGAYRVRSEVVAYRAWESRPVVIAAGREAEVVLRIPRVPVRLDAVVVTGRRRCLPPDRSVEMGELWEEARKALAAAAWTANRTEFVARLHRYRRQYRGGGDGVQWQRVWVVTARSTQPFVARAPEQLAEHGYVTDARGTREYYGPDANVLLHPTFLESHCFSAVRGRGARSGLIGLEFEPESGRRGVTDIRGTLWLDASSAELRTIEFQYTNLPLRLDDERFGGFSRFQRTASGAWILAAWELRMPQLAGVVYQREIGRLAEGGEVIELFGLDGNVEYVSPDRTIIRGTLLAADSIRPVPGASVAIAGTNYGALTDGQGRFELRTLLRGTTRLTTAGLDSMLYRPGLGTLDLDPGEVVEARFVLPPIASVHRELCGGRGIPLDKRALVGRVLDRVSDRPVPGVRVEIEWMEAEDALRRGGVPSSARRSVDEDGYYVFCDLPVGPRLEVSLASRDYAAPPRVLRFVQGGVDIGDGLRRVATRDRVFRLDFTLDPVTGQ